MKPLLIWLAAVALTVGGAIANGVYSQRWGEPIDLEAAGSAIEGLPTRLGDWTQTDNGEPLTEYVARELGLVNHMNRWYQHDETGARLQLLIMVGKPGPLVRHPPTVCYTNRAHEQLGKDRWIVDRDSRTDCRFRLQTYRPSRSREGERFFVAYSHSTGEGWDAPDYPRVAFGGAPALYKVQIVANLEPGQSEDEAVADLQDFVRAFVAGFRGVAASTDEGPSASP